MCTEVDRDMDRAPRTVHAVIQHQDFPDKGQDWRGVHEQNASAGGKQAVLAGVGQREVRRGGVPQGVYRAAVEGQGRRGRVVKVGRIVPPRDGVLEQEICRAGSPYVRRVAVDCARLELERGAAADRHGLAERHVDVDRIAGDVRARPVRRRDGHHARCVRVNCYPALGAERGGRARGRQGGVGVVADGGSRRRGGGRLDDRAVGARRPQGVLAGIPEGVRPLALLHHVAEYERVGAVAVAVAGNAPRVEQQFERPRRQDGSVEPDVYVDLGARPVHAVSDGRGGDVDHGRRRQPDQLDERAVVDEGVPAAAQVERCDVSRPVGILKAGHAAVRESSRQ